MSDEIDFDSSGLPPVFDSDGVEVLESESANLSETPARPTAIRATIVPYSRRRKSESSIRKKWGSVMMVATPIIAVILSLVLYYILSPSTTTRP